MPETALPGWLYGLRARLVVEPLSTRLWILSVDGSETTLRKEKAAQADQWEPQRPVRPWIDYSIRLRFPCPRTYPILGSCQVENKPSRAQAHSSPLIVRLEPSGIV